MFKRGTSSFTLIETIVALGLMVTVILEVSNVQGRAIWFGEYNRKATQASWLAKAVMTKVEWGKDYYDLKELKFELRDQEFDEVLCPRDPQFRCDFKYNIEIKPWPVPLVDMLGDALLGPEGKNSPLAGMLDMFKSTAKDMLGEEILKVAHVEVFWPEGSERNSVKVTYLLTNQLAVDEFVENQPPLKGAEKDTKGKDQNDPTKPPGGGGPGGGGPGGGKPPGGGGGSAGGSGGTSEDPPGYSGDDDL
jgi:uncharacterized membrane protein YgcG